MYQSLKRTYSENNRVTDRMEITRTDSKALIIRITIDIDAPEEGPDVTMMEAGRRGISKEVFLR